MRTSLTSAIALAMGLGVGVAGAAHAGDQQPEKLQLAAESTTSTEAGASVESDSALNTDELRSSLDDAMSALERNMESASDEVRQGLEEVGEYLQQAKDRLDSEMSEMQERADSETEMDATSGSGSASGTASGTTTGTDMAAETEPSDDMKAEEAAAKPLADTSITAEKLLGMDVRNRQGEDLGEVSDIVLDKQGVTNVVLSVGGFLGIGDKEVAIPASDVRVGDSTLFTDLDEAALEKMSEFDASNYDSAAPDAAIQIESETGTETTN
jgi:sporulation protein YlmC with PRC-barrel domain/gas vesicle protein